VVDLKPVHTTTKLLGRYDLSRPMSVIAGTEPRHRKVLVHAFVLNFRAENVHAFVLNFRAKFKDTFGCLVRFEFWRPKGSRSTGLIFALLIRKHRQCIYVIESKQNKSILSNNSVVLNFIWPYYFAIVKPSSHAIKAHLH